MPQIINTNIAAMNAQRNLNKSQTTLQTSMQRLSSGLRINSAKDDAAGLAISDRFIAQINGMNQAVRNANDGISLAQTAEGALDETTNALQRMRTLAVQAINDTNSDSDRRAIQLEIEQMIDEINRIGGTTQFNGKNLLDGSDNSFTYQIGANAGQTLTVRMEDLRASALGQQPGQVQTNSTRVALSGDTSGNIGVVDVTDTAASADVITVGVAQISVFAGAQNVDIAENRYGGSLTQYASGDLVDAANLNYGEGLAKQIASRVNFIRDLREIDTSGQVIFEGVFARAETNFSIGDLTTGDHGSLPPSGTSLDFNFVGAGALANGDLNINGVDIGPVEMQNRDSDGSLVNAINAKTYLTGVKATIDEAGALNLLADDGRDVILTTGNTIATNLLFAGGGDAVNGSNDTGYNFTGTLDIRITGQVIYSAQNSLSQTGSALEFAGLASGQTTSPGEDLRENQQALGTIANADVTTVQGANVLLSSVDSALEQVDSVRAILGAAQNRFEMTIRNLENVAENLSAANSRIRDADFALETSMLTRSQILQQAGTAILTQANAQTQNVLALLQG